MTKWEYKIESTKGISNAQKILDKYGQDGWELHFQDVKEGWWDFIFKRKIED